MNKNRFIELMQNLAPIELAEPYDNPGLIIDCKTDEINKVLVALDCTKTVADEAIIGNYDIILTHHPLIFNPVKSILKSVPVTSVAYSLIENGIGLFSAHTNLDKAIGGVNDSLCKLFELKNIVVVEPENFGRVGDLNEEISLLDFCKKTDKLLNTRSRCAIANFRKDPENIFIKRVGVLGGSGGEDIFVMKQYGADVFITGEIKHNYSIDAQHIGLNVLEAGHYETENPVLNDLICYLQKHDYSVQYKISECESSPLKMIY